jgi:hypothetical protein
MPRLASPIKQLFQRGQLWWRFYQQHQGELREAIVDNVVAMLSCGLSIRGYALFGCSNPGCSHTKKVAFSCKSRFCPTCGKKATDQWIATQQQVLPHCAWQHITFTMPGELWPLFKENYALLGQLSALAANTLQQVARKRATLLGIFTALHTFGRDLKYNVHLHLSVTLGGLCLDHSTWKALYFPKAQIMPPWRYGVITLLRQAYQDGRLVLTPTQQAQWPTLSDFNTWLDTHYRKAWVVHFAKPSKNPRQSVNYLGRYLKRPPLAQSRLRHYDGQRVIFEYLNHATGQHQSRTDSALEFIARFVQHIPAKGFRLIRYYGFLANRVRSALLPKVYALLEQAAPQTVRLHWPTLSQHSFGLDPLQCILCHAPLRLAGIYPSLTQLELSRYHEHLARQKIIPV